MSVRIVNALDESGRVRPGLLLAMDGGQVIASAARVAGSVPEQWVGHARGSQTYVVGMSELGAREWLAAQAQTGQGGVA